MATTYKFVISMPVTDTLPRNRISNSVHLQHTTVPLNEDLEAICSDIAAMYTSHYGGAAHEVQVKCYDTDALPNYPRAEAIVNAGSAWTLQFPREVALCLSFCGENGPRPRERGRIYLMPALNPINNMTTLNPSTAVQTWALGFYEASNNSFPDIGGVDWKFGIYSPTEKAFHQAKKAWVDDEWDTVRRRGLRATSRVESIREG